MLRNRDGASPGTHEPHTRVPLTLPTSRCIEQRASGAVFA
jgi:hypothetical protein